MIHHSLYVRVLRCGSGTRTEYLVTYTTHFLKIDFTFIFQRSDSLNIMKKFSINQDEDVWSQLLYGIRYLDLRVGYYKTTPERFWVVHDFVKMNPLYEVVNDIRRFLTSTKELVILDFHRYENL